MKDYLKKAKYCVFKVINIRDQCLDKFRKQGCVLQKRDQQTNLFHAVLDRGYGLHLKKERIFANLKSRMILNDEKRRNTRQGAGD